MNEQQQQYLNKYIDYLTFQNRSIKNIKFALKIYFNYLNDNDLDALRVKINDCQNFQTYLVTMTDKKGNIEYTKGSVASITGSVTGFYDYLKKEKLIYSNPFYEIKKLKLPKVLPKNIPDEKKTNEILKYLRDFNKGKDLYEKRSLYKAHVTAELMYSTGARINEIAKIKPEDIDFMRGVVRITDSKSRQMRDCILNEYTEKILRIYVEKMKDKILFGKNNADNSLLFGCKYHLKIWFNAILQKVRKDLKLTKLTSHYFRHALGCHLLRAGCDIRIIQGILGHKALSSTQVYTNIEKEDLRNIIDKYHPRSFRGIRNERNYTLHKAV